MIWQIVDGIAMEPKEIVIRSFRRFLPEGPIETGGYRKEPLVQIVSDPGGVRTLALHEIRAVR